jgi:murein DD-endopeptidase MepM/ murein hydrolase activator NlpD
MSDRFFTFMVIPEKSDRVRKISIPTAYLRLASVLVALLIVLAFFVFFDYIHLLSQVAENKKLKLENHLLRIDVQEAKGKLETLDQSVSRLKSFAHKLRVISNLDQPGTSKLLEAPTDAGSVIPTHIQEEESGSIDDPNASTNDPSKEKESETESLLASGDIHDQLEYQRSLTRPKISNSTEIYADNILGELALISSRTEALIQGTLLEEENFADLQEHIQDNVARLRATPSILPARGWISSHFGYRMNPFSGRRTFHAGIDVANFTGTPVHSPADGIVSFVGPRGGYGNVVQIDHGYGIVTRYGHNSRISVNKGQRVRRGEKIAEIGSTGRSTAPHLHYEVVLNGRPVNPLAFILEDNF